MLFEAGFIWFYSLPMKSFKASENFNSFVSMDYNYSIIIIFLILYIALKKKWRTKFV
jgi:hypothetical protein